MWRDTKRRCSLSVFLAPAILAASLLVGPLVPEVAMANISYCRTDPVVILSNGRVLDLSAQIADTASDIRSIAYTVHVPAGVSATQVLYTPSSLNALETLHVYADNQAHAYDTDTRVSTATSHVSVSATTMFGSPVSTAVTSVTVNGQAGQDLVVHLTD